MKIAIIIPYFTPPSGKLPNYFEYWQKSAAANEKIDFIIPSNVDSSQYTPYDNIHFLKMEATEFWDKVEALAKFPITRDYYKVAEYRPLCGLIFRDILKDYDYWGHSDFDLVYGDILSFVQPYLNRGDEVIGKWGHFRLIKNTDKLNIMPYEQIHLIKHPINMKEAFTSKHCFGWDEIAGMGLRYYQAGIPVVSLDSHIADINRRYQYFMFRKMKYWGFTWNQGTLTGYNDQNERTPFLYAHFQKRKLSIQNEDLPDSVFCIVPNRIVNSCDYIPDIKPGSTLYTFKFKFNSFIKFIKDQKNMSFKLWRAYVETCLYRIKHELF